MRLGYIDIYKQNIVFHIFIFACIIWILFKDLFQYFYFIIIDYDYITFYISQ